MAPAATSKGGADGGDKLNTKTGASAKSSTKMSQAKSTKRASKELSQAPNKKQKSVIRKAHAPRRRMSKKKQKEVSQAYQRLLETRKIFGQNRSEGEGPEDSSTENEQEDNLQEYIDNREGVEDDLARNEQRLITTALKKCSEWVDLRSPIEGRYILRDIATPLTPIQFATLGWMLGREAPSTSGRGGIIAHDMGMGKTLMALTIMVINKTGLERRKANDCATLVVVPSYAVIDHWEEECERHAPTVFSEESVARYRDLKPVKRVDCLKGYKIVFATYAELAREVPDWYREPINPKKPFDPDLGSKIKNHAWRPIFQAMWYRVVLDEAHTIKNRAAKSSLAVRRLQKRCAWAISGTIASNSRKEMFPYFNFLGMEWSTYSSEFNDMYFPNKVATTEYQEILTRVMMRRKIGANFLGETIIALPCHHASTEKLQPSAKEMVILNFIKEKIKETAEKSIMKSIDASEDNSTIISKAWYSITSLLHLYRFAGIHPFLIEKAHMREFTPKDNERLIQELKDLEDNAEDDSGKDGKTDDAESLSIEKILGIALQHRKLGGVRCCACNKRCVERQEYIFRLPCGHYGCWPCLSKKIRKINFTFTCRAKGCSQECKWLDAEFCPTLYQPIPSDDEDGSQTGSDRDDTESEPEDGRRKRRRGKKKPKKPQKPRSLGPGCDLHGNEPLLDWDKRRFLACADKCLKKTRMVVPSAKIVRVQELLREWHQSAPDDKIIIFTQFMVVASLVGRIARLEGIDFLYYTGDLSEGARACALERFKTDDSAKVLITSLMCGGQALNISCANRVILMELWWNSPAEEQAFGRVYRMGQQKEVHVVRLRCKGTREDEILEMQHRKEKDIRNCLMSKKMTKLDHTKHTIFSLMGFPVMENGKVVGLSRPRESYMSDTSAESDRDEQDEEDKGRKEECSDAEEPQNEDNIGSNVDKKCGEEDCEEVGGEGGEQEDQGKTKSKEETGKDCEIEVDKDDKDKAGKDCDIDVDKEERAGRDCGGETNKEEREKDGAKQEKGVEKGEREEKARKEGEMKVDKREKAKNEEPEKEGEKELTDKMEMDVDVDEDEKEGAGTATGMAKEETSRGDETDKMDLD